LITQQLAKQRHMNRAIFGEPYGKDDTNVVMLQSGKIDVDIDAVDRIAKVQKIEIYDLF
jgi:hypothetical protein